jgi:hypothetical protein
MVFFSSPANPAGGGLLTRFRIIHFIHPNPITKRCTTVLALAQQGKHYTRSLYRIPGITAGAVKIMALPVGSFVIEHPEGAALSVLGCGHCVMLF